MARQRLSAAQRHDQRLADTMSRLPDYAVQVYVGWVGGWDRYAVDPRTTRAMADMERLTYTDHPTLGDQWLKGAFVRTEELSLPDNYCVRILAHLDGGN